MAPVRRNVTTLSAETAAEPKKPGRKLSRRPSAAVAAERKALAIRRHAEKATPTQIAAEANVSLQTVKTWMRDKVAFPPHSPEPPVGSAAEPSLVDPLVEAIAAMWAEGKTYGPIMQATGLTKGRLSWIIKCNPARFPKRDRSASGRVAGARRRAGPDQLTPAISNGSVEVDETTVSIDTAPVSAPIAADPVDAAPAEVADGDTGPAEAADERPARDDAFRPLPGFQPVPLIDALSATCRWPVYPAGRTRFGVAVHCCGRATGDLKRSYCDTHTRMARGAGSSAERAAHKVSRLQSPGAVPVFFASQATGA
ncbi:helix-turn-helix domain-containing protein [Antarcticirhabdus aurantiaca]|uniref:helix-turn-helix domain-containing protein n=1 Tax=Antarcticirhabdus aurantiaca TaxID=2606717 RepID=UPI00131CB460|nr:helix-turn-helix domain-containing protein [Antarcticirhabdus aurantiaca]